jgi:hypothetical protein
MLGLAAVKLLMHLPFLTRYGYHHDELYFIACGNHLSFGYVDHAPLVPWIARLSTTLFGESLFALRIFATLSGAITVFLVCLLVRRLGGGRFAQLVAGVGMIIAPVYLRTANMLCLPAFEPLFWVIATYLVVRISQEDNPRLWLWVGVVVGLGLLNKHSMLFFAFGLVVGLLLTPLRKHFKSLWLYGAGAISLLFLLPNLIWQISHDWPTLDFLLNLKAGVMSGISLLQFIGGQFFYLHPFNAILWISGLIFFLFTKAGKSYRLLGWIWLAVFLLLVITKSKIYYLAPAYVILIAGGGISIERWVKRKGKKWLKPGFLAFFLIGGTLMIPVSVPILNINSLEKYIHSVSFGAFKNIYELTGDLRGMFGWDKRVKTVAKVYQSLSLEEQKRTVIWAFGYGNAGAIDYFGKKYGLPNAVSLTKTYWIWGIPDGKWDIAITMGIKMENIEHIFEQVEKAAEVELKNVNPWQTPFTVLICRFPKRPLTDIWKKNRPW